MSVVRFGPFVLDASRRSLECDGVEIALQPKVFDTLSYFLKNPGRVISRRELLEQLWPDTVVGDAALSRCIKEVRRALGDDPQRPAFLSTIPRVGYRFEAELAGPEEAAPARPRILAVLPFRPVLREEADPGLEFGMADTLITRLSSLREVVVRPLAIVRRFTDPEQDPLDAGNELGVDAIVEGNLLRAGDRLRVSVRVLRCADGRALLAEQFDESFGDLFEVQDAVCRRIASAISQHLEPPEQLRIAQGETGHLPAYRQFLKGRLGLGRLVPDEAVRSIEHFERALDLDPNYALALASIAEANIVVAWQGLDTRTYYERARTAARRAVTLQPRLGSAWSFLATVDWEHDWNWEDADEKFERALELAPNVVDIWGSYSACCAFSKRSTRAVELGRRAKEVDPTSPMASGWLAQALHMAGRSEEAVEVGESLLAKIDDAQFTRFITGIASLQLGRLDRAAYHLERAAASGRPDFIGVLAHAYIRAGRRDEADALENTLREQHRMGKAPPLALAMICAAREDADGFFEFMATSFEEPNLHAPLLASEPLFEPMRSDPRAQPLIERLHLPDAG